MVKHFSIALIIASVVFVTDQFVKQIFLDGFRWHGEYFSLVLAFNKGVAFSMFAFLAEWLKWIQLVILAGVLYYMSTLKEKKYFFPFGLLLGAGFSNIYDRFVQEGVVDYVYWHKWFEFAIFNLADVIIDIAVIWLLILFYKDGKKEAQA